MRLAGRAHSINSAARLLMPRRFNTLPIIDISALVQDDQVSLIPYVPQLCAHDQSRCGVNRLLILKDLTAEFQCGGLHRSRAAQSLQGCRVLLYKKPR